MNTEQAIEKLKELQDGCLLNIDSWAVEPYIAAIKSAIAALREKAEREGCVWCKEDNKIFHDGQHFHFFCSYCGKRLEV